MTERMLFKAVRVTLRATSPLAICEYKFAEGPPGAAANNINPTANSGGKARALAMKKQMIGKSIIWVTRPTMTALGYSYTRLKSAVVSDKPRPVIMMARATGIKTTERKLACMRIFLNLASDKIKEILDLSIKNIGSFCAAYLLPVHRGEKCGADEYQRTRFIGR